MTGNVLGIIKKKLDFVLEGKYKIPINVFGYVHHIKMVNGKNVTKLFDDAKLLSIKSKSFYNVPNKALKLPKIKSQKVT